MDKSKFNDKNEWRKFAFGLSIILLIIASIQWYLDFGLYIYFVFSGVLILLFGLTIPTIIKPIYILFSYISLLLSWIMTRIILTILFYFIFTPIGLIKRIFGSHFLNLDINKNKKTYWQERQSTVHPSVNYKKQF